MSKKIITPVAMLSYPNLYEPRAYGGGEPKYSAALVFPKGSDLSAIKAAIKEAAKDRFGDKAAAILKANNPLRTDADVKGYPEGSTFFNAKSTRQPQVVTRYGDPKTKKPVLITEDMATEPDGANEIYPGLNVKALISVYAYDTNGNRGVAFGLEGLQRWEDGERLDGARAVDVFSAEMPEEADIADLDEDEDESDGIDDIL